MRSMKNIFVACVTLAVVCAGTGISLAEDNDSSSGRHAGEKIQDAVAVTPADNERLLETIGATTSASLYLGYLSLASIRDNVESQRYESAQVEALIGSVVETIAIVTEQLKNMKSYPLLSEADSAMIADMSEISALLEDEAIWLKRYSRSQSAMDLENFEEMQKKAWEKLKLLFGNEEEKP